jgi:SSS family solute:Na+ symporter
VELRAALVLGYAAAMVAVGAWVSRRVRRADDFFVAGRDLSSGLVFATLLAANIGAGSTVGATGLAYAHGAGAWWWNGSAALGCLVLGLWVAPRMHGMARAHGFLTVGDFLEWRYDRSVRGLVAGVLALGCLAILAGQLLAMAWAFEVMLGWPRSVGCTVSGAIVVAYVTSGGLLASAWVNLLQLVVLLGGFLLAVPFARSAAGSLAPPASEGLGVGGIAGLVLALAPAFVVSPGLIQKTYGARTASGARRGALANGVVLAAFATVPVVLGSAARAVRPDLPHPELALPTLFQEVLPPWLGALGLAALFAAEVSTADAVLFMLATSVSRDVYGAFLRRGGEDELLRVARASVLVSGVLGVVVASLLPSVAEGLKAFYALLTAALFVPLTWGLASPRPGAGAARAAIVAAVGLTLVLTYALSWSGLRAWLPGAAGITAALAVYAGAGVRRRRAGCR